ncbi:MAG: slipin family protein [Gammaproteobacteria bacterium]|nr:slipin family protein [Gammaproteobacteria bacterium]
MWFTQRFLVCKHEVGLLFRDGDFERFLNPGEYRFRGVRKRYSVETHDQHSPPFEHELSDYFIESEPTEVANRFSLVTTARSEIALVFANDRAIAVVGPTERRLFWKTKTRLRVERFNYLSTPKISEDVVAQVMAKQGAPDASSVRDALFTQVVPEGHIGLLYQDGRLTESLPCGHHAYWRWGGELRIELIDLRIRTLEVQGQEILTKDKVTLRVNVTASYQFRDAEHAFRQLKDPLEHLYKEIQFAIRSAIGTRTLDALLEDKTVIDRAVAEQLVKRFSEAGLTVLRVGVKDIILPGEMKDLLAQVVEAEKAAQANVIRRREETNATRSLLNTAKVMESNAVALRLKELETLEKVTERIGNLSVYGGLEGLLNDVVKLKP